MRTVLLIEDNISISENVCEMLELQSYIVFTAENGRVGIAMAKEKLPDVILCDIMMPEVNGYEVLNELKRCPETAAINFIFFTASTEKKDVEIGLQMGAKGYIRKPFEEEELYSTIAGCFAEHI